MKNTIALWLRGVKIILIGVCLLAGVNSLASDEVCEQHNFSNGLVKNWNSKAH